MGLRDWRRRLVEPTDEVNAERLRARFGGLAAALGASPIAEAPARSPARVCGEVAALQVVPRAGSPWLEVAVDDGTGRVVAVFSGRTRIAGVSVGRALLLEGVAGTVGGRLQVLNPTYTLLPHPD